MHSLKGLNQKIIVTETENFEIKIINNRIASSHTVIIKNQDKWIVIDPGIISKKYIKKFSKNVEKIDEIWLTHIHPDHSQGVNILKRKYKSKVCCHIYGKKIIESKHPKFAFVRLQDENCKNILRKIIKSEKKIKVITWINQILTKWIINIITTDWRKTIVDKTFDDGEIINGIKIFHLPGHSPDEVGFYIIDKKILITGDLIIHNCEIANVNNLASDINEAINSLRKILEIRPEIIIPAHGKIINNLNEVEKCLNNTIKFKEKAKKYVNKSVIKTLYRWTKICPKNANITQKLAIWGIIAKTIFC